MLWYLPWSENIKKRACRYLLQRYLGNFLEEKLTLDQLSVDLYNGTGTVCDVSLDCEALNELGDSQSWPLEIVDGYMQEITVTIPWSTILKDDSLVEVNGLSLTVQPKVRSEPVSSMLESMWSSMSSSMQLAADCLRQEDGPPDANPVEGIEMFAHAIDSILCRVKVRFINTKIRLEHVPKNSDKGIALEIHIKHIEYYDEAGAEPPPEVTDPDKSKTYIVSTYTNKRILFEGVTLYTDEFPSKLRTMARSLVMEKSISSQTEKSENGIDDVNFQSATSELFYETKSVSEIETVTEPVQKREATPEERANQPDPILFAKLTGKQELGLKIKNTAEAYGPKVDLQLTLGSLIVFMTPRQLHTIIELADGMNQPHLEDNSNIPLRSGMNLQCKPMRQADFQLIEAQLLGNLTRETRSNLQMYGWTGQSFDDSDAETDRFQPMSAPGMAESCSSMASSVNTSMSASVTLPTANPRTHRNKKVPQIDGDPTAEVSHINIKFASCSCILLHKDILVTVPLSVECVTPSSARKMQETAEDFFRRLGLFSVHGTDRNDFHHVNQQFDQVINRSHLRLITSALSLEGNEKTTSHGSQTNCEVTINHALIRECLYNGAQEGFAHTPDSYDIVKFQRNDIEEEESDTSSSLVPDVRINLKQTLKYVRISGEKRLLYPTTDLVIKCMPVTLDVDLTLLDRMSSTIYGGTHTTTPTHTVTSQNQANFTMHCDSMDVILRFPIADLRPLPYSGVRRVRSDFLRGTFADLQLALSTPPSSRPTPDTYTARATHIHLYYHECENSPGIHIAHASMSEPSDSKIFKGATAALPTISLTIKPPLSSPGLFDPFTDADMQFEPAANPMTTSMYLMDKLRPDTQPNPFSSKKTAHQSVAQHEGAPQGQAEELIVPGNEEEMSEFTNHCTENSSIHLDLNLPILSLQLESKQLYEILYNRINSDLLLWEPVGDQYEISPHLTDARIHPPFSMCNNHHYDSDSASSSSDDENLYYSTYDGKPRSRPVVKHTVSSERHHFCLTLQLDNGLLTINTPVRDANKRVVPGQMGELCIEAKSLSMCLVSGLNGLAKTAQLALRAHTATLYHDGLITIPTEKSPLRTYGTSLPLNLRQTIYPSGKGVKLKAKEQTKKDMLTLALSVEPQMDLPNFKRITVSLGLSGATYRHRGESGVWWMSQLLDVLDVDDYPVSGYTPPTVLTQLHVHIGDAAVDYRPLYLPIRAVVTLGSFSISSNVIAATNTTSLRFLAQECGLHLCHIITNTSPNSPVPLDEDKQPELVRDYVKVVELGLFELSLRMAEKSRPSGPWVDVSVSNDVVRVWTCADSATALGTLLAYLADHGDVAGRRDGSHRGSLTDDGRDPLLGLDDRPEEIRELSQSEIQQVNDMMAEAMKESPNTTLDDDDINSSTEKEGVEIFFFPDESNMTKKTSNTELEITENKHFDDEIDKENIEDTPSVQETNESSQNLLVCSMDHFELGTEAKPTNAQVVKELGDPTATPKVTPKKPKRNKKSNNNGGGSTDEEYCIVDCDTQCDDELAEPAVRWISDVPAMCDNHFTVPAAKSDVLKAPKNFPAPQVRYTLCEMSVVWVVYGGHDFPAPPTTPKASPHRKNVTIADPQHSPKTSRVSLEYEPYSSGRAVYRPAPRPAAPPPSRDKDTAVHISLHKVKFQHETYPTGGTYAARQTLAVGKIEVLDRLANSHINKLLSQYALNDEPERKNAHMLVVKAVHLRPDPTMAAQECCLKVSLLPLRFNIDQDTLAFLVGFFGKLGSDEPDSDSKSIVSGSSESAPRPPVMGVTRPPPPANTQLDTGTNSIPDVNDPLMETYEAERLVTENLIQLEEDFHKMSPGPHTPPVSQQFEDDAVDDSPLYFRRVVFSPEVPIRLDYVGKRVDLSAGPVAGLLMGLGQLNCSELRLKRLYHRNGLLGVERLLRWALQEWLSDIKRHQLPGLLSGIGPMHSLLQFVTGIRDLIWLPVEQWRRDGRVVHGLRRGAASFTARTAVAALDITTRILQLIQATAEGAFDMLTPTPALSAGPAVRAARDRRRRRRAESHPSDIRDGVATAYHTVKEGIAESVSLVSGGGGGGGVGGVVRAGLSPVAAAAGAGAMLLGGLRAHLATDHTDTDKWRITEAASE